MSMDKDTLLIDGLCGLCTKTGKFISNRQARDLEITEQDSEIGIELLNRCQVNANTLVLIRKNKMYSHSSAAIRCLLYMRWNWIWLFPFAWIIPRPIRDLVYNIVSSFREA